MDRIPMLTAVAYDRAAHRRTQPEWLADAWRRARVLAVTPKSAMPVETRNGSIARPLFRGPDEVPDDAPRRFLGVAGEDPYFAVTVDAAQLGPDVQWRTLRDLGSTIDDLSAGLFTAAIALEQWHQRHTHCSICGTPTEEVQAGWTRRCPNDGSAHFPRTDPAIITVVHDGADRCLLGRNAAWPVGRYSTLAGFVEPGESLEAAVAREVYEEVAVHVVDTRYIASQPWPFPSSLMLGFSARVAGEQTLHPDLVEMAEAGWFTREEVRRAAERTDAEAAPEPGDTLQYISPPLSISRYLIDLWLADELG